MVFASFKYMRLARLNNGLNSWLSSQAAKSISSRQISSTRSIASFKQAQYEDHNETSNQNYNLAALIALATTATVSYKLLTNEVNCESKTKESKIEPGQINKGLPTYTTADLKKHGKDAQRIWVSYKNGVYDITEFVLSHPGGNEKILMAAGDSIEPYWSVFALHHNVDVYAMLETLRIGNLEIDEETKKRNIEVNKNDPWQFEPTRSPLLKVHTQKPFNAESPKDLSVENIITPNSIHFIRNHLPVPKIDMKNFKLEIVDDISGQVYSFQLNDLKEKFPHYSVPVTIQCSGNKRKFMSDYESVHGLQWDVNAISTAEWTGVKLVDVLKHCKIDFTDERVKHVQFEGLDKDPTGSSYGASIPKEKAFDVNSDVLIAFQMNGVDIPLDNGYPLRVIVPGVVGARSVKWLSKIKISNEESLSFWQRNDYKVLSTNIKDLKQADFSKFQSCQESPVQSAICQPVNGSVVKREDEVITVKGYAYSGGGKAIDNVIVSFDNGESWETAEIKQIERPYNKTWSWAIWEYELTLPKDKTALNIICVATDSAHNTQPEGYKAIWNARGLMNNAWHRIHVDLN